MKTLQKALEQLKAWMKNPQLSGDIERYIATGDAAALARIQPSSHTITWSWGHLLAEAMAPPPAMAVEDRRALHVLGRMNFVDEVGMWLEKSLAREKPGEDFHALARAEFAKIKVPGWAMVQGIQTFARAGRPTSAGRFLLSLSDVDLQQAFGQSGNYVNLPMTGFLLDFAPERVPLILNELLDDRKQRYNVSAGIELLLGKGGRRFEEPVAAAFQRWKHSWIKYQIGTQLVALDPDRYGRAALEAARASLAGPSSRNNHVPVAEWMLSHFGKEVLPDISAYVQRRPDSRYARWDVSILSAATKALGKESIPVLLAAMQAGDLELCLRAVSHLLSFDDGAHDSLICQQLERGLADENTDKVVQALGLVARWKFEPLAERIWALLFHKSKPVREAAARTLAKQGDAAMPRAGKLLEDRKSSVRLAAVSLLCAANTPLALRLLEDRLDAEPDDEVRDAILLGLESAWAAAGRKITRKDIDARIARAAPKLEELKISWLRESKLPPLLLRKGPPLDKQAVRYLLYRQSRAREIRADVEAKPLYALIDRSKSGDFALEVLKGFLASKADAADRWALALAGLLGDDRIVPLLTAKIREWADSGRGKMAEYAVQSLALLGSDAALLTVDALAIRYRTKNKNIGKAAVEAFTAAAEQLGITPEELGDKVVPWLGFEPGKPRIVACGGRRVEARIGLDFKLQYVDLDKNKAVASLPKTAPAEVLAEFKDLGAALREVVKAQTLRLENLMVRQYRWPAQRWTEMFLHHPLLLPFAIRLVWGAYDAHGSLTATFRALEDRTLTTGADESFEPSADAAIGMVHPLELTEEARSAWQTHLADYEIEPPFPQMERTVVLLPRDQENERTFKDLTGTSINAMTFKGRAEKLGWNRGSVCDGGSITTYVKSFPAAGVDAFLGLDGMFVGIDMYSDITLQDVTFVRSGSIKIGSYVYDEPSDTSDERVLAFAAVPPIVYSEVMGDLRKIAGQKSEAEAVG